MPRRIDPTPPWKEGKRLSLDPPALLKWGKSLSLNPTLAGSVHRLVGRRERTFPWIQHLVGEFREPTGRRERGFPSFR
jgi:hypothetical protein